MVEKAAVIGFGCAGYHAVRAMRQAGWRGEIHVYTDTDACPANPMLTTYYVSEKLPHEGMFPFGPLDRLVAQYDIMLHPQRVSAVDSVNQRVICEGGHSEVFDRILFATGARALVPSLPGADNHQVYCMRTPQDAEGLKARLDQGGVRSALIVGASMVGIKLVELLQARNIGCILADRAPHIFPLAALPVVAAVIEERLVQRGVELKLSAEISAITETTSGLCACFRDGSQVDCDIVLLCIGTRANTELADAGITVNRGIMVDSRMATSAPHIYAAGDCCEGVELLSGQTQIVGLWANAAHQGEVAGSNMAGQMATSGGAIPHNITHFMDMDFIGAGDSRANGTLHHYASHNGKTNIWAVLSEGKIVCLNLLDGYGGSGALKQHMIKCLHAGCSMSIPAPCRARLLWEGIPDKFLQLLEQ